MTPSRSDWGRSASCRRRWFSKERLTSLPGCRGLSRCLAAGATTDDGVDDDAQTHAKETPTARLYVEGRADIYLFIPLLSTLVPSLWLWGRGGRCWDHGAEVAPSKRN